MGIADQPVILDRLVAGIFHPPDQIPAPLRTVGRRCEFSRQTTAHNTIGASRLAVGGQNDFLEHRSHDVEVGFFTDKASGSVRFGRAANPVEPDLDLRLLGADSALWADDADL